MAKVYTVEAHRYRSDRPIRFTGTVEELTEKFAYTLSCGASWQHEKGNKKINRHPKTIASLVTNLNNAENNSAANGCASTYYTVAVV